MTSIESPTIDHALYDEAVTRYAELASPRAVAVYRWGEVRRPGRDLAQVLVVTDRVGLDNRHFFSPLERLPARYRVFAAEPFILPPWSVRAVRHLRPQPRSLLCGRDVLHAYAPDMSEGERLCRLLETYCRHAFVPAGDMDASQEAQLADQLRAELSDGAGLVTIDTKRSYRQMTAALDDALLEPLGGATMKDRIDAARAVLQGDRPFEGIDQAAIVQRSRDVNGYFQELASMGFPYGALFPYNAYPRAVRALPEPPVVTTLVRNFYRVRRRLFEYAGA